MPDIDSQWDVLIERPDREPITLQATAFSFGVQDRAVAIISRIDDATGKPFDFEVFGANVRRHRLAGRIVGYEVDGDTFDLSAEQPGLTAAVELFASRAAQKFADMRGLR